MRPPPSGSRDSLIVRERKMAVGVAVLTAATLLGGAVWLVRRQVDHRDVVQLRIVHATDPDLGRKIDNVSGEIHKFNDLLSAYLPVARKIAASGVDANVRMFPRREVG